MRKWLNSFRFWLTFLAVSVVIINFTQHDDYNILLALTSPVMWLAINFPAVRKIPFPTSLIYVITLLFWFLIGFALDKMIQRLKSK
ncbi:signal transduction histidine kinase [Paenibacillus turicensis]|uniref:Signal transduction histidine kinase n=1 Tax=Paenibacillus turicensis TaxID=160487 RepID=A0ABS4FNX5_9BACL|nr:signal transduction histidine kinase [Paenibacillus turicensis]